MLTLAGIAGALLIIAGVAWMYPPAGLIVAGLLILADLAHAMRAKGPTDDS